MLGKLLNPRFEKQMGLYTSRQFAALVLVCCVVTTPAIAAESVTVKLKGQTARFHPTIYDLLTSVSTARPSEDTPKKLTACVNNAVLFARVRKLACGVEPKNLAALATTQAACRNLHAPLELYTHFEAREMSNDDMSSIPKMLRAFGAPVGRSGVPTAFQRTGFRSIAESITLKIFTKEISQGLEARKIALESVGSDVTRIACDPDGRLKNILAKAQKEIQDAQLALRELRMRWKTESNLPVPTLTHEERTSLALFLSAMTWRARGGGVYQKIEGLFATQTLRIRYIWTAYETLLKFLGAGEASSGMAFDLYTRGFKGWGDFWDMGTNDRYTLAEDFRLMTERGNYQVGSAAETARSSGIKTGPLERAGAQMGACYLFGWHGMPAKIPRWGQSLRPPYQSMGDGPTGWGELCFGAALGLGLAETFKMSGRW